MIRLVKQLSAITILFLLPPWVFAQEQLLKYNVLYNGDSIGSMSCFQKKDGEDLYLKLVSSAQLQLIMKIKVDLQEESVFKKGKLLYSSSLKTVNGKEKGNKQTKACNEGYRTFNKEKTGTIKHNQIDCNISLLYYREPKDNQLIYSDSYQQLLKIKQTDKHLYKLELPDGNYNFYHYKNGICHKVEIHHTLYTIHLQLTS